MLGMKLSDAELPIVCSLCLGSTLCHPHEFKCGKDVESDGRHGFNCDEHSECIPKAHWSNCFDQKSHSSNWLSLFTRIKQPPQIARSSSRMEWQLLPTSIEHVSHETLPVWIQYVIHCYCHCKVVAVLKHEPNLMQQIYEFHSKICKSHLLDIASVDFAWKFECFINSFTISSLESTVR